jgi:NAD(P) transhydrogenase subunit alpha
VKKTKMRPSRATKPAKRLSWQKPGQFEKNEDCKMDFSLHIAGFLALYIFMLAGFSGWVIIGHVPAILHTPLMSGSNFVHGIVVVGGMSALLNASSVLEQALGFCAVLLGAGNAAGGFAVTRRMLAMFQTSEPAGKRRKMRRARRPKAA